MSQETIAIVKSTASAMQTHGVSITKRVYERLFRDPEMEALFDRSWDEPGGQPKRLATAILAFAQNADKLEALAPAIERISIVTMTKRSSRGARPTGFLAEVLIAKERDLPMHRCKPTLHSAYLD